MANDSQGGEIPAALPGIVTGIILSIGRAVGETAAVILTAGSSLGMPFYYYQIPPEVCRFIFIY